jgi:circadian clock protein KaiB
LRSERSPVGETGEVREILMGPKKLKDSTKEFEKALALEGDRKYVLRLYVTGTTPKSVSAIRNIRKICDEHLKGAYDLEVIDIYQQPVLAKGEQIIAAPTLLKKLPLPLRRFIGDMSNTEQILLGLDLRAKKK